MCSDVVGVCVAGSRRACLPDSGDGCQRQVQRSLLRGQDQDCETPRQGQGETAGSAADGVAPASAADGIAPASAADRIAPAELVSSLETVCPQRQLLLFRKERRVGIAVFV